MAIKISKADLHTALDALGERATPVYSARKRKDGAIVLNLCGRTEPVIYKPLPDKPRDSASDDPLIPHDFRSIKGVGAKSATDIIEAGIRTFAQLGQLNESDLLDIAGLSPAAVKAILKWQKEYAK